MYMTAGKYFPAGIYNKEIVYSSVYDERNDKEMYIKIPGFVSPGIFY